MADTIFLYISAASDLNLERDSLSRAIIEVPVPLGWRIVQSPIHGEPANLEAVAQADMYILLLGSDIRAPIGQEWLISQKTRRKTALYLKGEIFRTMAGLSFQHYVEKQAAWKVFTDVADLRQQVLQALADHLLEQAVYYQLSLTDIERLQEWRKGLIASVNQQDLVTRGEAGESSVILSVERYVPSEGVLITPDQAGRGFQASQTDSETDLSDQKKN